MEVKALTLGIAFTQRGDIMMIDANTEHAIQFFILFLFSINHQTLRIDGRAGHTEHVRNLVLIRKVANKARATFVS